MLWANYLCSEFRHVVRSLFREPGFALTVVVTIALGSGPSVVILSAVRAAALPPVPYEKPEGLFVLSRTAGATSRVPWGLPKFEALRQGVRTVDLTGFGYFTMHLSAPGDACPVTVEAVASNYFSVLRAGPRLGRTFRVDENTVPLGHPVVVLSERVWRERFGAAEDAIGRTTQLNGQLYTVVGVMPEDFTGASFVLYGLRPPDVWLPLMMAPAAVRDERVAADLLYTIYGQWMTIFGRLKDVNEARQARAEARLAFAQIAAQWPTPGAGKETLGFVSMQAFAADPRLLGSLQLLQMGVALVFVISVFNLVHLFAVRGLDRQRDSAIRLALGARPLDLMGRHATEAILLGCAGAGGALALAWVLRSSLVALRAMATRGLLPHDGLDRVHVDGTVVASALGLALFGCVISALVGACQSTPTELAPILRNGTLAARSGFTALRVWRPRGLAAATQTALAVALVAAAFLFLEGFSRTVARSAGLRAAKTLALELQPPESERRADVIVRQFAVLASRAGALPGIEVASVVSCLPVSYGCSSATLAPDTAADASMTVGFHIVLPDSFRALGIQLLAGRDFSLADDPAALPVVIVNETAARQLGGNPIGRQVRLRGPVSSNRSLEIVGVVTDVRYGPLSAAPQPDAYVSYLQTPTAAGFLVVRANGGGSGVASTIRRQLTGPMVPSSIAFRDVGQMADAEVSRMRMSVSLMAGAAAMALVLAGIGLFAILSHSVQRAIPEIGIRLALGATGRQAAVLVIRYVGAIAVAGAGLGALVCLPLLRYVGGLLESSAVPTWASVAGAGALALVGVLAAAVLPAYRASHVQPSVVLRQE